MEKRGHYYLGATCAENSDGFTGLHGPLLQLNVGAARRRRNRASRCPVEPFQRTNSAAKHPAIRECFSGRPAALTDWSVAARLFSNSNSVRTLPRTCAYLSSKPRSAPLYLQTPHLPPSRAQCRQYLQFLQALQGSEPVHVAEKTSVSEYVLEMRTSKITRATTDSHLAFRISLPRHNELSLEL